MRKMTIAAALLLCTVFGSACSRQEPAPAAPAPAAPAATAEQPAPATTPAPAPNNELNQAIQEPLDKAKAVEGQLQENQEKVDQEVGAQGG